MTTAFEKRSDHSTFRGENPDLCKTLLKDFVTSGGDWSSSELSPAIRDDPVLQQQCRTRGFMIMQMGDQLRQVYCGSPTLGHTEEGSDCPQCGQAFCLEHLAEHMGASTTKIDPTAFQIGQPASPGENPNPYLSAPPGVDTRPGMSSWDNRELNRNELWEQKQRLTKLADLKGDREASSLVKAMWRHIRKAERERSPKWIQKNGDAGEHTMEPAQIVALDPVSRLVFEVWAYNDEYKAPASTADIAVELATRGIDEAFQEQLEQAAHSNENWLPQVLEELAAQGLIDKSPYGGWVPATRVVTKGGPGSGIEGHTTPKPEADLRISSRLDTLGAEKQKYYDLMSEVEKIPRRQIVEEGPGVKEKLDAYESQKAVVGKQTVELYNDLKTGDPSWEDIHKFGRVGYGGTSSRLSQEIVQRRFELHGRNIGDKFTYDPSITADDQANKFYQRASTELEALPENVRGNFQHIYVGEMGAADLKNGTLDAKNYLANSWYVPGEKAIYLDKYALNKPSTLIHELGHHLYDSQSRMYGSPRFRFESNLSKIPWRDRKKFVQGDVHLATQKKTSGFYDEDVWQKEVFSEWYAAERLGPEGWKQTRFVDNPRTLYGPEVSSAFDDILKKSKGEKVEEKMEESETDNIAVHTLDSQGNIIGVSYSDGKDETTETSGE